jgi:cardiolipin synthase
MEIDWLGQGFPLSLTTGYLLLEIAAIAASLEAILKTRTSQGAIAWALSLIFMPLMVLPLYLVFGRRKFNGYRKARRMGKKGMQIIPVEYREGLMAMQSYSQSINQNDRVLETITSLPFLRDNQLHLLIDGDEFFQTLFNKIASANHYIALSYYIVRDDETGQKLKQLLLDKAAQGIHIYFLYDEIGSLQLSQAYRQQLQQTPGIDFVSFNTTKGKANHFQLNFRNHRKITVIDGHCALLGGLNIGDEYRGLDPKLSPWRDTGICIEGPAVCSVQLAFLEDWYWATEYLPELCWQPKAISETGIDALVLPTGPADSGDSCTLIYLHLINMANQQLWIVSPYFVPDQVIITALTLASLRGVDVRIMLPKNPDHLLVQWSSRVYLKELVSAGVGIYYYKEGFLHQKVGLIDNLYATVGSPNLDNRSFRLNFEINLLSKDTVFAARVKKMLEKDMANCQRLGPKDVEQAMPKRLLSKMAHLLAPIL